MRKKVIYLSVLLLITLQLAFKAPSNALPLYMDCMEYATEVLNCGGTVDEAIDALTTCEENGGEVTNPPCPL